MEISSNTFRNGMILDINDLDTSNDVMTNSLNATIASFNGNEGVLQNDYGNTKVGIIENDSDYFGLTEGYSPLSSIEYGGIIYIVSFEKDSGNVEIGSIPSPDYNKSDTHDLLWKYQPLKVGIDENGNDCDLRCPYFGFNFENPLSISIERSFDNSVNLIINDGLNQPYLINSGFHAKEFNKCQVIKRYGKNNTNRYNISDQTAFKLQTSLYKDTTTLSKFEFNGLNTGGQLKIGNYTFYAIVCDKDGNESDIICESGMIPVFLGTDGDPFSIDGGILDMRSDKFISLSIKNIDENYQYLKLFYTRCTSDKNQNGNTLAYKINKIYEVINGECSISITGYEEEENIALSDLNTQYFNASSAKTSVINQNILFLGNINKESGDNNYEILKKLSLYFYPIIDDSKKLDLKYDYSSDNKENYYSSKFIYNYTGYHPEEIYRFGIVYINNDGSLTNAYDILGRKNLNTSYITKTEDIKKIDSLFNLDITQNWDYTLKEDDNPDNKEKFIFDKSSFNNKGVSKIGYYDLNKIIGIKMQLVYGKSYDVNSKLKELGIKGYFFVRQKRIPTILAQAYTTNICEESFLPSINVNYSYKSSKYKGYLYESFFQGGFTSIDGTWSKDINDKDNLFYPKSIRKSMSINNNYQKRLFTLTNNCRCYFDKKSGGSDAVTTFWEEILNYKVNFDDWTIPGIIDQYGGENDDDYVAMILTNSRVRDGEYTTNPPAHRYRADWFFFKKIDTPVNTDDVVYGGNYWRNKITSEEDLSNINTWASQEWSDSSEIDDNVNYIIQFSCGHSPNIINWTASEGLTSWKNDYKVYEWIVVNGVYYKFYTAGPGHAQNKSGDMNSASEEWFRDYKAPSKTDDSTSVLESDNSKGFDLDVPTFDGKYAFKTENVSKTNVDQSSIKISPLEYNAYGGFCPEFELNQPYYNNLFTGQKLVCKPLSAVNYLQRSVNNPRLYYYNYISQNSSEYYTTNIINVPEDVSLISLNHQQDLGETGYQRRKGHAYFSSKAGDSTNVSLNFVGNKFLAYTYPDSSYDNNKKMCDITTNQYKLRHKSPFNLVRGIFSPYLGMYPYKENEDNEKIGINDFADRIVNIYIPNYNLNDLYDYFNLRFQDSSSYQTISDRISLDKENNNISTICYRGDSFITYFTHRVNRNFNDSSAPFNDEIISRDSYDTGFKSAFKPEYRTFDVSASDYSKINIGDLNAVQLGSWVTFPIRSSMNLCLRSTDNSNVSEKALCGQNRAFYPLRNTDASGNNKISESVVYNSGFSKSGGDKYYFTSTQNVFNNIYYKNRILYSKVLQNSSLVNNHRVFLETHYRDYTDQYGSIIKLLNSDISGNGHIIAICEHGILSIPINERLLATEGSGGNVFINTSNILPENPIIISDTYGTTFPDSVIKTPFGIYGIDVLSKKIWYTDGSSLQIISDFKVQSFLNKNLKYFDDINENINIKTHYNKYKNDVLFTGYNKSEQIFWNLCYNINSAYFQTFYSWIPSISENIGNNFISVNLLDKTDKKWFWKHGESDRVPSNIPIKPTFWYGEQHPFEFEFVVKDKIQVHKIFNNIQIISNKAAPESFHYYINGECYDFKDLKKTAYIRQELHKDLINQQKGYTVNVDNNYKNMNLTYNNRSIAFPMYYTKYNIQNVVYDSYKQHVLPDNIYNFDSLSGTELIYNNTKDQIGLYNHVKAVDLKEGQIRGNMRYIEDNWLVQINPINYLIRNENKWNDINDVPIILSDLKYSATSITIPEAFTNDVYLNWVNRRQEIAMKDKYIKIKIRYSGEELALIDAVNTIYTISYA